MRGRSLASTRLESSRIQEHAHDKDPARPDARRCGIGCCRLGGDDDGEEPRATSPPADTTAEPPAGAATAVQIAADPSGALKYATTTLTATAGKVNFEFTNDAPLGHDFVIEQDDEKVAGTDVITESSTTLDTELEAGEYAFYCSVAGHRAAGMEGTLTVE